MSVTKRKGQRRGDVKKIKIEGGGNKEQEVTISHETGPQRKERSTWDWHDEFAFEWSQTFITKKRKRNRKKGE